MLNLSPNLRYALAAFLNQLFLGQIKSAEALARALDKLSDLAWEEAESEPLMLPPSMRLE